MTPQEFKAWFEGYAEGIDKAPSDKQWKRIKARVGEIDGRATDRTVFVDRYWPDWRWRLNGIAYNEQLDVRRGMMMRGASSDAEARADRERRIANNQTVTAEFSNYSPEVAFNALGRADALADA